MPNRFLLLDRISRSILDAQRVNGMLAVLSVDLDDFKKINDSLDYKTGDKILVEASRRLQAVLRHGDTVGRPGGDEFIILLSDLDELASVVSIAENILGGFRRVFRADGRDLMMTASIGIAIYPNDGDTPDVLLRNASSAMHHSKLLGKNRISFFTQSMNHQVALRLQIEEHMHVALERGEFIPYYQPKVDVTSRQITGFEVLLRWHCSGLGDVSPEEFIPIAEDNGLIVPIGEFVLQQAMNASAELERRLGRQFSIAVNISPRQFYDENLLHSIRTMVANSGVSRDSIELEITEGVLMSGNTGIKETLVELKNLGMHIAMDDFGTGYSSLSYLRNYPFDTLKIDREFISDIANEEADRQLVNASVAMAHGLGLKVVAEGVETEEQMEIVALSGCNQAQGYLFSKAMPFKQAIKLLT